MDQEILSDIEIAPREVRDLIQRGRNFLFVDVREKWEHETSRIDGAVLISMRDIPANLSRLANAGPVALFCHHGIRSLDAAAWLREQGVQGVRSMSGGIDRWAAEIDPRVPRY